MCVVNPFESTRYCVLPYAVQSLLNWWLELSMSGQDTRVSHCAMPALEQCMQQLCNATNHDPTRHVFRSKHSIASKIGDIFRSCLWGMLGYLTPRARNFSLPFIRDASFLSYTVQDLHVNMSRAFGDTIFQSLTDVSYNTKASQMVRSRIASKVSIHRSPSPMSPLRPKKRKILKEKNHVECTVDNWPQQVSDDVKIKCMRDYFRNTMWQKPAVCAVCARDRYGILIVTYELHPNEQLPDAFQSVLGIPHHSIHKNKFVFGHEAIDTGRLKCYITLFFCLITVIS